MDEKTCTKCGEPHPATTEWFDRQRRGRFGLSSVCKSCRRAHDRERYGSDPDVRQRVRDSATRYREAHRDERLAKRRADWAENRETLNERRNAWRAEHPGQIREQRRRHYQKHRETVIAKSVAYGREHKSEQRERNQRFREAHPYSERREELVAKAANERAARRNAPGTHTAADVAAQRTRQRGKCYWCGSKVGRHYHVDHVTPLARGGSNGPENLVIACATCNLSKGARLPHEWGDRLL